jgi:hypothetical protein
MSRAYLAEVPDDRVRVNEARLSYSYLSKHKNRELACG